MFPGDGRSRTGDLLLAKQALYQLSYIPVMNGPRLRGESISSRIYFTLGLSGFEPETSPLSRARSNQLS